jgi:hypothetical protein
MNPETAECPGRHVPEVVVVHAEQLVCRRGRIRERPKGVEDRPRSELRTGLSRMTEGRMMCLRKQENKAGFAEHLFLATERNIERNPQCFEHVGAATPARGRSIAVFRYRDTACSHGESGTARQVERMGPVSSRAAGIEYHRKFVPDADHRASHRLGRGRQHVGGLAHDPQGDCKGAHLYGSPRARENRIKPFANIVRVAMLDQSGK